MKLKKGSAEAKRFMAKIRAMRTGTKTKTTKKAPKKIGATKFFDANLETKSSKPKRSISVERRSNGTFKKFDDSVLQARRLRAKLKAKKNKSKISGVHKDTKSHNVRISVVSGIQDLINERNTFERMLVNKKKQIDFFMELANTKYTTSGKTIDKYFINQYKANIVQYKKQVILYKKYIKSLNNQINK
jgi:hypothetical protein